MLRRSRPAPRGRIAVRRTVHALPVEGALDRVIGMLDRRRGMVLGSSFEFPGRYTRWDIGFVDPPLMVTARARDFRVEALSSRGQPLLAPIARALGQLDEVQGLTISEGAVGGTVTVAAESFAEEERSRQPSTFSVLRALIALFRADDDPCLGLYGAFGYDLGFQFEPVRLRHERTKGQRDLVLYLPDELVVVDRQRETAARHRYEFDAGECAVAHRFPRTEQASETATDEPVAVPRSAVAAAASTESRTDDRGDHEPGQFAETVRTAHEAFRRGDLFEVTPSQTFHRDCSIPPSELFRRLRASNPAPYLFSLNLGESEHLVGASPEMYVRVTGRRVETCPIAGTIARGRDAVGDAEQILRLLNSRKDEAELTMCTDVDRNDKSRVCEAGSVRLLGRRQIEVYSRLVHTVDHIEGVLRDGYDALDAFLAHTWAVTVTGAPKKGAMQFIEDHEKSPRAWYGGAIGRIGFDGNLDTGLTLRTVRLRGGRAEIRAGATLLHESDPQEEEHETELKAAALFDALSSGAQARFATPSFAPPNQAPSLPGRHRRILLVDHQDSFVHTLANYFRQTGAEVTTLRSGFAESELDARKPDLVVLSPGPGSPRDFGLSTTLAAVLSRSIPCFGVCLGLQGIVEHFGGTLGVLARPMHGRASRVRLVRSPPGGSETTRSLDIFRDLPPEFDAGRYHSLFAIRERLPVSLRVTAESDDGVVMAIEHVNLPLCAVQFHPESVMSAGADVGLRLVHAVTAALCASRTAS